ncbi:MAG: 16S rRNA (cytosine(1402)-N(4))-methyltransferase RsmH [Tannerella sp.]|jgi:16S rRNA (cytosine1402-N4)-methyltransferase|nr:16S rRNA (cytosine(1402)-N(4))-methyltransferase RsmH [Tannerella sp.]
MHGVCYHVPVLFDESLNGLDIQTSGIYVDLTFGGGGHARGILERLGSMGKLYAFDQDADTEANIPADSRFVFVRSNFRYLLNFMRYHGVSQVDGILADLGVSSHHFDDATRGFSFRFDSLLDMRMNNRAGKTAADILNTGSEETLATAFYLYGELKVARKLAARIVEARAASPIRTATDLLQIVRPFAGRVNDKKFLAQVFQALRIHVNDEMQTLREMLNQALHILKPGGRMVVITYHSLEDRMVKNFFRTGNFDGESQSDFFGNRSAPFLPVNSKVITPSPEEIETNPRARSAKLRIAEKKQYYEPKKTIA